MSPSIPTSLAGPSSAVSCQINSLPCVWGGNRGDRELAQAATGPLQAETNHRQPVPTTDFAKSVKACQL